jgi:putative ABC transport system substrate-binding protein
MVTGIDPVANGWVASLARPGGNITGIATLAQDLNGKRLELLTEIVNHDSRMSPFFGYQIQAATINFKEYEAGRVPSRYSYNLWNDGVKTPTWRQRSKLPLKIVREAIFTITTAALFIKQKQITDLAVKHQLPTMFQGSTWVDSGGLMSYSTNDIDALHRAATYVDKILKGAKAADLPVEQPTKYEMVINLKTAKQIGLVIPPNVLARADRVIR